MLTVAGHHRPAPRAAAAPDLTPPMAAAASAARSVGRPLHRRCTTSGEPSSRSYTLRLISPPEACATRARVNSERSEASTLAARLPNATGPPRRGAVDIGIIRSIRLPQDAEADPWFVERRSSVSAKTTTRPFPRRVLALAATTWSAPSPGEDDENYPKDLSRHRAHGVAGTSGHGEPQNARRGLSAVGAALPRSEELRPSALRQLTITGAFSPADPLRAELQRASLATRAPIDGLVYRPCSPPPSSRTTASAATMALAQGQAQQHVVDDRTGEMGPTIQALGVSQSHPTTC